MDPIAAGLARLEQPVVENACAALERRRQPHYAGDGAREKLRTLFERLVTSIEQSDDALMSAYVEHIAEQRLASGVDIAEVQTAFNVLEEAVWAEALRSLEGDERAMAIHAVSRSLAAGRDALARTYVALARHSASEAGDGPGHGPALVGTEVRGRVGIVTLQDERKRNALGSLMAAEIVEALDSFASRHVRAVVIRSREGADVWSSGHDVGELPRGRRDPLGYNDPLEQCVRAVRSAQLPVIAMVHGSVWGGAFDLVLSCDLVIADETATFAITPANLGLPYNTTGLLHFLGRLPVNVVKEMFFTARPIEAHLAERWMVVNHLVPASELVTFTLDLAETMATKAPLAIAAVKEQLRVLSDYQPVAAQVYERIQGLRRETYDSADYLEGLAAFGEKREPRFKGA